MLLQSCTWAVCCEIYGQLPVHLCKGVLLAEQVNRVALLSVSYTSTTTQKKNAYQFLLYGHAILSVS